MSIAFEEPLPFAHYSDPKYKSGPVVVWGQHSPCFANYDDRIYSEDATKAANQSGKPHDSPAWWCEYLKSFHNVEEVDLRYIAIGVNRSNGYMYRVLGYGYERGAA